MLPETSTPMLRIPPGGCDCHVHVFDPARFHYAATRSYTPAAATVEDLSRMHARMGMDRVVLAQPSCYGTDNAAMLDAIAQIGQDRARGVAVVDFDHVTAQNLQSLHAEGIRGLRLNFSTQSQKPSGALLEEILKADAAASAVGWSVHLHVHSRLLEDLGRELAKLKSPIAFDHFAGFKGASWAPGDTAWRSLLALLEKGGAYVKLSAPYRVSTQDGHPGLQEMARELVRAAPSRLLWGSDWPHTGGSGVRSTSVREIEPFRNVNAGAELDLLAHWIPDPEIRQRIFVDNPSRLFGFADPA